MSSRAETSDVTHALLLRLNDASAPMADSVEHNPEHMLRGFWAHGGEIPLVLSVDELNSMFRPQMVRAGLTTLQYSSASFTSLHAAPNIQITKDSALGDPARLERSGCSTETDALIFFLLHGKASRIKPYGHQSLSRTALDTGSLSRCCFQDMVALPVSGEFMRGDPELPEHDLYEKLRQKSVPSMRTEAGRDEEVTAILALSVLRTSSWEDVSSEEAIGLSKLMQPGRRLRRQVAGNLTMGDSFATADSPQA